MKGAKRMVLVEECVEFKLIKQNWFVGIMFVTIGGVTYLHMVAIFSSNLHCFWHHSSRICFSISLVTLYRNTLAFARNGNSCVSELHILWNERVVIAKRTVLVGLTC